VDRDPGVTIPIDEIEENIRFSRVCDGHGRSKPA
jgi:hypothetical protein